MKGGSKQMKFKKLSKGELSHHQYGRLGVIVFRQSRQPNQDSDRDRL